MMDKHLLQAPVGELLLFQSDDCRARRFECFLQSDTLWFSQASMADQYDKNVSTINEERLNTIAKGEFARSLTTWKFRMVLQEGKRLFSREIEHHKRV
ncbi:hypothetical protein A7J58_10365 [Enterobacter cloacae]|nr:hypothetical protein A7J56_10350 [Enterobacter cloacae]OAE67861.1 hypothetical protein A7J58_10365 [Enterobacter cloacae]OAZ45900.1 hypothetical protein A9Z41_09375 [Enterobacter cloacae]